MCRLVDSEVLFHQRVVLERAILSQQSAEKESLESLRDSIDRLSAQLGHRQLCPATLADLADLLRDPDGAMRQQAASTLSLLASRSVFNQFYIGCQPGIVSGLVALLQEQEEGWLRGPAASALAHLAANSYSTMQTAILAQPGVLTALIELLHDTQGGLSGVAALTLRRLCENHPKNQTVIGQAAGAVSGLVALLAGPDVCQAEAAREHCGN